MFPIDGIYPAHRRLAGLVCASPHRGARFVEEARRKEGDPA